MSESITIYTQPNPAGLRIGEHIRVKSKKRLVFIVTSVDKSLPHVHTFSCKGVYSPAPKSKLHNKTVFSKIKAPLYLR